MVDLIKVDRLDIRACMRRLRDNEALYLHGTRISHIHGDKFRLEYFSPTRGINVICERNTKWVRRFLKTDWTNEDVYSTNYNMAI